MSSPVSEPGYIFEPRSLPALLSLVIPVYNEQTVLPLLLARLRQLQESLPCPAEVILVNDGSSDGSLPILAQAARQDARIKVLSLARNFGHQLAATAGLDFARGDAVVLMDADLQDPPELVHEMLAEYRKGFDVVYAQRVARQGESWGKRFTAWLFYRLMRALVHPRLPPDAGDFRLISRPCLDTLCGMRETHRFLRGMLSWVGFPQTAVRFVRPPRAAGRTKYPLHKMLAFAWNAATSFSPLPLRLVFGLGFLLATASLGYTAYAVSAFLLGRDVVRGWTSGIAVNGLVGGAVMMSIGILGEYVGKIFEQVKARPLYVVASSLNLPPGEKKAATP